MRGLDHLALQEPRAELLSLLVCGADLAGVALNALLNLLLDLLLLLRVIANRRQALVGGRLVGRLGASSSC